MCEHEELMAALSAADLVRGWRGRESSVAGILSTDTRSALIRVTWPRRASSRYSSSSEEFSANSVPDTLTICSTANKILTIYY